MSNRVWIRDSIVWTTDVGSSVGTLSIDLLLKARTGETHGGDQPILRAEERQSLRPGVFVAKDATDVYPDMRAPIASGLPTTLNIQGARISRIRLQYGLIFAPTIGTPIAPDYEHPIAQGWFEGLIVAPFNHAFTVIPFNPAVLGHPQSADHAVQLDWIWWSRKYIHSQSFRTIGTGVGIGDSAAVYSEIDTKNSRSLSEFGDSLYWQVAPSGPGPSAPIEGSTINGGVANWSVLLDLP